MELFSLTLTVSATHNLYRSSAPNYLLGPQKASKTTPPETEATAMLQLLLEPCLQSAAWTPCAVILMLVPCALVAAAYRARGSQARNK